MRREGTGRGKQEKQEEKEEKERRKIPTALSEVWLLLRHNAERREMRRTADREGGNGVT